jgi:hypothetical protein
MRIAILAVGVAGLLAACSTFAGSVPGDPSRDNLGVAAHQPTLGEGADVPPAIDRQLAWKMSQLCTNGNGPVQQDLEPAERNEQLVDWQFRCSPYRFSVLGVPLAGVVPQPAVLGGTGQ